MDVFNELRKHKHVVFGSDHYRTLGVVRSLGERGISADVILHPKYIQHPYLSNNSKYVGRVFIVDSVDSGYKKLIEIYGSESLKPFVYTCDDWAESCLDLHHDEIFDKFYFFNGTTSGIVTHFMDKDAISKLAEECGAKIPKSETLKKGELPKSLKYPVITKSITSTTGAWKSDSRICYSSDELIENYKTIKSDTLLVEEFIVKKNELCLDGFSVNGGKQICLPYQATYLRLSPIGYSNYMTIEPIKYDFVKDIICRMLQKVGFNGIFSVEFLIDQNDELYFLEVNFRNSTWSYAYTVGGINLPYEWAKSTFLGHLDNSTMKPVVKPFKAIAELKDYNQFVKTGEVTLWEWVKDVITAKCRFYIVLSDMKPVFAAIKTILRRRIRK